MLYKRLIINGTEYLLAVSQAGSGAPTAATSGSVGVLYMDADTGDLYKCTGGEAGAWKWEQLSEGGSGYTLPVGGDQLGGVKNGGNVVINPDGTMTAPVSDSSQNVELDTTLTQSGKAADAKAVGDKFAEITGISLVEPAEDDIPKIFFGDALQQTKDEKVVSFRYISKTQDISGYAEIKAQGNSSMSYPKKNQTVKLFKDAECTEKLKVDFKGWGKQNKHCYKANWIDLSHARNVVSARLWGDIVKSRANYAELPELLRTSPNQGAIDGFPVKVYAAGVYQGRYTINIPKDAWMANMDKDSEAHCILCGENYVSGCFRAAANINGSDWSDEIHDTVPASIKTRWNEVISFVMNSADAEFKANLGQYFYVDSLIDYYLFGLTSCGLDAFGKNQLYMTYDGQRWIATMYDMDSTWGLYYNGQRFVSTDYGRNQYEDHVNSTGNLLYVRLEQLFYAELQTRWAELKNGALSMENIINRFERFTDIAPAELVKEDYASTTGGGKFTGIPSQSTNNIQQIRSFALARRAWTDEYVAGLTPEEAVPCTGITLSASELTFTEVGTQTLTATVEPENTTDSVVWSSDVPSVATVTGGVVTAKANGSCVITATCGEYSETCAVSVSGIAEGEEPDQPDTIVAGWSETASYMIDTDTGVVGSGKNYVTLDAVKVEPGSIIEISNSANASYQGLYIYQYDKDMVFLTVDDEDSNININSRRNLMTDKTEYVRFAVWPNNVATNNNPAEQIIITYREITEQPIPENGLLYILPEATTFDGTNYIDTEVDLNTEDAYTVCIDVSGIGSGVSHTLVDNMTERFPYPGWAIDVRGGESSFSAKNRLSPIFNADRNKVVVRKTAEGTIEVFTDTLYPIGRVVTINVAAGTINHTVYLGAYYNNGDISRYAIATMHDCRIYDWALSYDEVIAYLKG